MHGHLNVKFFKVVNLLLFNLQHNGKHKATIATGSIYLQNIYSMRYLSWLSTATITWVLSKAPFLNFGFLFLFNPYRTNVENRASS